MIKRGCQKHLDNMPDHPELQEIQKIVSTNTAYIIHKCSSIEHNFVSLFIIIYLYIFFYFYNNLKIT